MTSFYNFFKPWYSILIFATLFGSTPILAQTTSSQRADSLKQVLSNKHDSLKIPALIQLAWHYQYDEPDSAMWYTQVALNLAHTLGDEKGRGDALITRGRLKRDQGNYSEALEDLIASQVVYQSIQDSAQLANALNDISIVYAQSGDDEKALQYFEQTLELFRSVGDTKGESHALNNIGIMHQGAGQLEIAKDYYLKSLEIKLARNDTFSLPRSYANIGSIYKELNQNQQAWDYYYQADSLFDYIRDKQGRAINLQAMAELGFEQDSLAVAQEYATLGLSLAQEINGHTITAEIANLLAQISEKQGNYNLAYRYLQQYSAINDSLTNDQQQNKLEQLKAEFDNERQAHQIAILQKEQQLQKSQLHREELIKYAMGGGMVVLVLLLAVVGNGYRVTHRQKQLLSKQNEQIGYQQEKLAELNRNKDRLFSIISHDIKSPLNTLKGFIGLLRQQANSMSPREINEVSGQISESLDNLSRFLENLLSWSLSQFEQRPVDPHPISIFELVEETMQLYWPTASEKQLSLINRVSVGHQVWADTHSVYTILRNLLANSIKFSHPQTTIVVDTQIEDQQVIVGVTDQGVGMDEDIINQLFALDKKVTRTGTANEKGSGFGLKLCQELAIKNGGQLWVSSQVGKGSTFFFSLPVYQSSSVKLKMEQSQV